MEVIYFKKLRARFIAIYTHPVSILSFLYLREVKVIQAEIPSGTHGKCNHVSLGWNTMLVG